MKIKNKYHREILDCIIENSGAPTQHTFSDRYLGNTHKRYPISAPILRTIAKEWMRERRQLPAKEFVEVLTSLNKGDSSTEKCMAGILLDYCTPEQSAFSPDIFDSWLDNLIGWAEVDSVCTGSYLERSVPEMWPQWEKLVLRLSKSENINKRRASLVLLVSPVRKVNDKRLQSTGLLIVDRLKDEKDILITKAISWLLRSMTKNFKDDVRQYLNKNRETLPKIAVRETLMKLNTGRKSG